MSLHRSGSSAEVASAKITYRSIRRTASLTDFAGRFTDYKTCRPRIHRGRWLRSTPTDRNAFSSVTRYDRPGAPSSYWWYYPSHYYCPRFDRYDYLSSFYWRRYRDFDYLHPMYYPYRPWVY